MAFGLLEGRRSWIGLASELHGTSCMTLMPQERGILRIEFSLPRRRESRPYEPWLWPQRQMRSGPILAHGTEPYKRGSYEVACP